MKKKTFAFIFVPFFLITSMLALYAFNTDERISFVIEDEHDHLTFSMVDGYFIIVSENGYETDVLTDMQIATDQDFKNVLNYTYNDEGSQIFTLDKSAEYYIKTPVMYQRMPVEEARVSFSMSMDNEKKFKADNTSMNIYGATVFTEGERNIINVNYSSNVKTQFPKFPKIEIEGIKYGGSIFTLLDEEKSFVEGTLTVEVPNDVDLTDGFDLVINEIMIKIEPQIIHVSR